MATSETGNITVDQFQVIAQRSGLDLTREEMEHLLPLYQQLAQQVSLLHDPALPLDLPAGTFIADWTG
jgi:hypothetical protein